MDSTAWVPHLAIDVSDFCYLLAWGDCPCLELACAIAERHTSLHLREREERKKGRTSEIETLKGFWRAFHFFWCVGSAPWKHLSAPQFSKFAHSLCLPFLPSTWFSDRLKFLMNWRKVWMNWRKGWIFWVREGLEWFPPSQCERVCIMHSPNLKQWSWWRCDHHLLDWADWCTQTLDSNRQSSDSVQVGFQMNVSSSEGVGSVFDRRQLPGWSCQ